MTCYYCERTGQFQKAKTNYFVYIYTTNVSSIALSNVVANNNLYCFFLQTRRDRQKHFCVYGFLRDPNHYF